MVLGIAELRRGVARKGIALHRLHALLLNHGPIPLAPALRLGHGPARGSGSLVADLSQAVEASANGRTWFVQGFEGPSGQRQGMRMAAMGLEYLTFKNV